MKDAIKPLAIASVIMLAMALGQMPYGYYVLLKIAICSTFVILALRLKKQRRMVHRKRGQAVP